MKPMYLLSAAVGLASIISCAQDIPASKVPSVVLNAAKVKYAQGMNVEWEKKNNYYEAEFNIDSIEHCLHIDAQGILLAHKWEIQITAIPEPILRVIESEYVGYSIDDATTIEKDGQRTFEIELEAKGKKDLTLNFNNNGQLIN